MPLINIFWLQTSLIWTVDTLSSFSTQWYVCFVHYLLYAFSLVLYKWFSHIFNTVFKILVCLPYIQIFQLCHCCSSVLYFHMLLDYKLHFSKHVSTYSKVYKTAKYSTLKLILNHLNQQHYITTHPVWMNLKTCIPVPFCF